MKRGKTITTQQYRIVTVFVLLLNVQWYNFLICAMAVNSCNAGDKKDTRSESWEVLETYPHNPWSFTQVCGW